VVKEEADLEKTEHEKRDGSETHRAKKTAVLRRDTEALVAALGGRCVEFPTNPSVPDLLEWFQMEVAAMPTAFADYNKNINCFMPIHIFRCLWGRRVNIFRSLRNWFYPVMLHSFKIFLKTLAG
jgi:hypothetical protein